MDDSNVAELFKECDVHDRNYLEPLDLHRVCPQLSNDELHYIFDQLDINKDGKVTKDEFLAGFVRALQAGETAGFRGIERRASVTLPDWPMGDDCQRLMVNGSNPIVIGSNQHAGSAIATAKVQLTRSPSHHRKKRKEIPTVVYNIEPETNLDSIPCQDEVLSLYEQLQKSGVPVLLSQFEKVIAGVCKEIEDQKRHNENLQLIYRKEKERYSKQINEVETELDEQMLQAQEKARREERERMEREKDAMRQELESEIAELQTNIKRLQKVESILSESGDKAQKFMEMKTKMQEVMKENRTLKNGLIENKTEMALIKAKMARLRQDYNEKCLDLASEKDNIILYLKEKENLERQMQLLYSSCFSEANKQLHDANDNLRVSLETRHAFFRQCNLRTPSPVSSMNSSISHSRQTSLSSVASSRSSFQNYSPENQTRISPPIRPNHLSLPKFSNTRRPLKGSSFENDDDLDSGMVTRGSDTADSSNVEDDIYKKFQARKNYINNADIHESDVETLDMDSVSLQGDNDRRISHDSSLSNRTILSKISYDKKPLTATVSNGPPERTFRVVMAGDQAVGKSSLIMRLVKDKFIPSVQSTLGVDFHVKTMNVDGRNVAVQLWDTAGQERFRSLCKSYFRRADGAILVYDCTCEHSFLNVRNWMQTIQESAPKKIPILICANKVDLRISVASEGRRCIQKEDGEKLAQTFDALFVETSAKEGTNVHNASYELARRLLALEDFEVRSTLVLSSTTVEAKKSSSCGCK